MICKGDPTCLHMRARWSEVRDTGAGVYQTRLHACMAQSSFRAHADVKYILVPMRWYKRSTQGRVSLITNRLCLQQLR